MKSIHRSRGMCEWDNFNEASHLMRTLLAQGTPGVLSPFHLLSEPSMSPQNQRDCSELWSKDKLQSAEIVSAPHRFQFSRHENRKIRVGYLSNDFQEHATSLLLIEMFEAHNRDRFELYAYSYGAEDHNAMRQRLQGVFHDFQNIGDRTDSQAACAIHSDGIDILVDLKGYTQNSRTSIMMLHPAPIQVNYLGYPGTLGADICDYIITDTFLTPSDQSLDYSESFAYMPHSYQPHGRKSPVGIKPQRKDVGLPDTGFVFCCFNQAFKLTPDIFSVWCRLLELIPDSVLWLLDTNLARGNLRNEAMRRGIAAQRIVFAPDVAQIEHLGRLQLADLVLDTFPYGAHTTASDALWSGVPIVTYAGETFPSRVAGSLLHAVGMPELIAHTLEDYFDVALDLATNPAKLATLHKHLIEHRHTMPLFDVHGYTHDIENLFEQMWQRYADGLPHAEISTRPLSS